MFLKSFSRQLKLLSIILLVFAVTSCQAAQETDDQTGLPNPASVFCEEQGGKNETRTDASGGQYGVCLFEDGTECDQWAYFNGECQPGQQELSPSPVPVPAYVNETYGFSFNPPSDWAVESYEDYLLFTKPGYTFFVGFQGAGEEPKPFRTGMPQGEFVAGDSAVLLGQPIQKKILVFEAKNKVVSYGGRIQAGDLILVMYLDAVETIEVSYADLDIQPEMIAQADQIIASFAFTSGDVPTLEFNP